MKSKHLKAEALMINAIGGPNNTQVTQVTSKLFESRHLPEGWNIHTL